VRDAPAAVEVRDPERGLTFARGRRGFPRAGAAARLRAEDLLGGGTESVSGEPARTLADSLERLVDPGRGSGQGPTELPSDSGTIRAPFGEAPKSARSPASAYDAGVALEIRPLTGETWDALAALFREGGDPRWCWYYDMVGAHR
jgi:hypothetical protein